MYFAFPYCWQLSQRPAYFVFLCCWQLSQRPVNLSSLPVGNFHGNDLLLCILSSLPVGNFSNDLLGLCTLSSLPVGNFHNDLLLCILLFLSLGNFHNDLLVLCILSSFPVGNFHNDLLLCILPSLPVGNFHNDDLLLSCVFCLPFLWATFTTTTYSSRVYFAFPSCGQLSRRRPTPPVCILPSLPVGNFHDDDLLLPCVFCLPFLWATFTTTTYSSACVFCLPFLPTFPVLSDPVVAEFPAAPERHRSAPHPSPPSPPASSNETLDWVPPQLMRFPSRRRLLPFYSCSGGSAAAAAAAAAVAAAAADAAVGGVCCAPCA